MALSARFPAGAKFFFLLLSHQRSHLLLGVFAQLPNLLLPFLRAQGRIAAHRFHLRPRVFFNLPMLCQCLLRNSGNLPAGLLTASLPVTSAAGGGLSGSPSFPCLRPDLREGGTRECQRHPRQTQK
jgi:hypothetical protein